MTREKKFFAPELRTYCNDLGKRWRVEYWEPSGRRVVIYGDINKANTVESRTRRAFVIINSLQFDLPKEKNILQKAVEVSSLVWRKKTISDYTGCMNRFLTWLGRRVPETATEDTINNYLVFLNTQKINQNTIAKHRNMLFALYNKCIASGIASYNPVRKVAGIKRRPKSLQFFSDKQIELFKASGMDSQLWLGIRMLFYCFVRPGEQRHMRINWINFEYGFIEIPSEVSKNGKTEKVSIPSGFQKEIEYLQDYPNNYYVLSKSGLPGREQISTKWLNDQHTRLLKSLKIVGRYAFYSWKHTGVVKAVKAGINIKDLQLQLRHHSLDMVNEYLKNLGVMDSDDLKNKFPTL